MIFFVINVYFVIVVIVYGLLCNVNERCYVLVMRNGMEMWEKGGVVRGVVI